MPGKVAVRKLVFLKVYPVVVKSIGSVKNTAGHSGLTMCRVAVNLRRIIKKFVDRFHLRKFNQWLNGCLA